MELYYISMAVVEGIANPCTHCYTSLTWMSYLIDDKDLIVLIDDIERDILHSNNH